MKGKVVWWNPRIGWGRIKGQDGKTYFFLGKWVKTWPCGQLTRGQFKRKGEVEFAPDQTKKGREAYQVKPA